MLLKCNELKGEVATIQVMINSVNSTLKRQTGWVFFSLNILILFNLKKIMIPAELEKSVNTDKIVTHHWSK